MKILVIKLGALGDVVLAFQPFADIRAHHPEAKVSLLTTAPFGALLADSPWFDEVRLDARPAWWDLGGLIRLRRALGGFDLVYDLQTSARSSRYFYLAGRPDWSGIAGAGRLRHRNPGRNGMHTIDRQRDQLDVAGVPAGQAADLSWLIGDVPPVPSPFALLIPGAAPHRPAKRWPAERFGELALWLQGKGVTAVVAGTATEAPLARIIAQSCPSAIDLTGQTGLPQLAGLAARAVFAVGNDTGPMHLAAAVGCRCTVLFSGTSDPALTAPRGLVTVLREPHLADLAVARVAATLA